MNLKYVDATIFTLIFACNFSIAQTYIYDNKAQLIGAAIVSPEAARLILVEALTFCAKSSPSVKEDSEAAFKNWVARHKFYLNASAGYRDAAKQMAANQFVPDQQRAAIKKLIEVDFPRLVASQTKAVLDPLQIASENGVGEGMCHDYIHALDEGKFDLKTKDPQLADFYDQNAPRK
jgi:hypothetical protein